MGRQTYNYSDTSQTQLRPAGMSTKHEDTAKDALTWNARPPTPPHQRKYRQLAVHEPGVIIRHFGAAEDPIPEGPFGDRTVSKPGDTVAENMKGTYPSTEMGRWALEQAEDVYDSSKKEPLGRGYKRGHKIPDQMGTTKPFGMTLGAKELDRANQLKHVVFPTTEPPEIDDKNTHAHQLYVRSHQAYLPGEQRRRNYEWERTQVDPVTHSFGRKDSGNVHDGVKLALQPELDQELQRPKIASRLLEDHQLATTDKLGTVRKMGTGDQQLPPDHTFGMPSLKPGHKEPSVGEILQFSLTPDQQQADADLGKSLREGYRNIAPESRTFGVPTVRLDRPMPSKRSCASYINYGNEPDALQLLRPPRHVERGVNESHFIELRTKEDVQALCEEAEIRLSPEEFDAIFSMASEADGEEGRCCMDTFFRARHHFLARVM